MQLDEDEEMDLRSRMGMKKNFLHIVKKFTELEDVYIFWLYCLNIIKLTALLQNLRFGTKFFNYLKDSYFKLDRKFEIYDTYYPELLYPEWFTEAMSSLDRI